VGNITADKPLTMPTNEEGEFELVLGNKQLLSVFFIFIILLGLFFAMGYLWGRNSGSSDLTASGKKAAVTDSPDRDGASSMPGKGVAHKPLEIVAAAPAKEEAPAPVQKLPAPEPVRTAPVQAKKEPPPPVEKPKPLEISPVTAASKPVAPGIHDPAPGMYVQVLALDKAPAEVLADVLAKKGFHSMVVPGPNEKIFRVLVGPAKDSAEAARLKGDLEKAGFKEAFPKRY
jgi:cell division protein FtsN